MDTKEIEQARRILKVELLTGLSGERRMKEEQRLNNLPLTELCEKALNKAKQGVHLQSELEEDEEWNVGFKM